MRIVSSLLLALWSALALAQANYPDHPLRLVVPFPPGGATDTVARPLAQKLSEQLGHQVTIDNRGGAAGNIGAESVVRAAPDGYTLLMGTVGTQAINPALYTKLTFDPTHDLAPVTLVAAAPVAVVAHPSVSAKSIKELLELDRARPGRLTFGTAGSGTPGHLTAEIFRSATGASLVHVPYKGGGPALRRSAALPDVPTLSEAGVSGVETTAWWGVLAPAKTSPSLIARLNAEVQRALQAADLRERLSAAGIEPMGLGPEAFAEFQKAELAKWGKAVRESGATVD